MNKNWLYVILGGLLEIFWVICLKKSQGFSLLSYSLLTIILVVISFILFAKGMDHLPAGIAYTVFTGIGCIGTIVLGIVLLGEQSSLIKIIFSSTLLLGIIGLKISSKEDF